MASLFARAALGLAAALAASGPAAARAGLDGPDLRLHSTLFDAAGPALLVALADDPTKPAVPPEKEEGKAGAKAAPAKPAPGSLDFDLLGEPTAPVPQVDQGALRLRRRMLLLHQGIGFGLGGLQLATTATGQLNYSDKFRGGPNTGRYELTHKIMSYSTLGVFAANGLIALFAPSPLRKYQWDRAMAHRISMGVATLGMAAQAGLGIYTASREGYLNQERIATTHLAIGYVTLAAVATGVGVLVF